MRAALVACFVVTVSVLALLVHLAARDPKPLELTVSPRLGIAPRDLAIRVRVRPDLEQDRWIRVELDSFTFYRVSQWDIGNDQPLYVYWIKDVPAGEYSVVASMGREDRIRLTDRTTVSLVGP